MKRPWFALLVTLCAAAAWAGGLNGPVNREAASPGSALGAASETDVNAPWVPGPWMPPADDTLEYFGSTSTQYGPGGVRQRGNIYRFDVANTRILEIMQYLNPTASGTVCFMVYESVAESVGTFNLVDSVTITCGTGAGWYSSGPRDFMTTAGRYYAIVTGWEPTAYYYADLAMSPWPYPSSFGALIGQVGYSSGWTWAYPPPATQTTVSTMFTSPAAYYQALVTNSYTPVPGDLAMQSIDEPASSFVEPSLPFTPAATVRNPGTTPVSNFQVVYSIDDGYPIKEVVYEDTVDVAGPLDPDSSVQVSFADFTPAAFTEYNVTAYVSVPGDPYAANDTVHFFFRTWDRDVAAAAILAPPSLVNPDSTVVPTATFHNYGQETADFDAYFEIYEGASLIYGESVYISGMASGADTTIAFPDWAAPHTQGNHTATAYTVMPYDLVPGNDTLSQAFIVGFAQFGDIDTTITIPLADYALAGITFCPADSCFYFVSMADDYVYRLDPDDWSYAQAFACDNTAGEIPWGISWDGTYFWVSHIENGMTYVYDKQYTYGGTYTGTYYDVTGIGGASWMGGMDFDGTYTRQLAVGGDNRIYVLDLPGQANMGVIPTVPWGTSQRGCSWIPYTSELVSGGWNDDLIYKIDTMGTLLASAPILDMADVDVYDIIGEGEDLWGLVTTNAVGNPIHKVWMGYRMPTGVTGEPTKPQSRVFALNGNRPNPVRGRTTFSFTLPMKQDYALKVFNVTGQLVASFAGKGQAGPNSVAWNTARNGAGVYFFQLASGGQTATRRLVVVK